MNLSFLKYFAVVLLFAGSLIGCGSSEFEMTEGGEEMVQDELDSKLPGGQAIQDDVKTGDKISENSDSSFPDKKTTEETKFSNLVTSKKTFAVQVAAFNDEANAKQFIETNKSLLERYGVYCKNQDNLYKVLIGSFASLDLAGNRLVEIFSLGYNDTFILELQSAK
jgi:SPOR domain